MVCKKVECELNELDVQSADIENAYLTAPCREKCWTIGGKEFGSEAGKPFLIIKNKDKSIGNMIFKFLNMINI